VETFADRVQPNLKADSITQSYDKYVAIFENEEIIAVETVLLYFSGKDLMLALEPWWLPLGIQGAKDFRRRIRDWMMDHPVNVLEVLPEWQVLLDTLRQ
jgi:hypothetical protein